MVYFLFFGKLKHTANALKLAFNQKIKSTPYPLARKTDVLACYYAIAFIMRMRNAVVHAAYKLIDRYIFT